MVAHRNPKELVEVKYGSMTRQLVAAAPTLKALVEDL